MSTEVLQDDPFAIFGTKIDEVTSYDEDEKRDWSKTFYEPDPTNGETTALIKLCVNVFEPQNPLPKQYVYKLPQVNNPSRRWNFVSPSTIGQKCPVMEKWFYYNDLAKKGDVMAKSKTELFSRKKNRAVAIQIINDLKHPELNGQFRLLRFPEGMDIDKLIAGKIMPSENERKMGMEAVNVFDPFSSPLLVLICNKGSRGRDFAKSTWAPDTKNHGVLVPEQVDAEGNVIKYRPLTEADRNSPDAAKHLTWLLGKLREESISLKEQWMYKEPTPEILESVRQSIELIENGTVTAAPATTDAPATDAPATTAPAQAAPAQAAQAQTAPAQAAPAQTAPGNAAPTDQEAVLRELGIVK